MSPSWCVSAASVFLAALDFEDELAFFAARDAVDADTDAKDAEDAAAAAADDDDNDDGNEEARVALLERSAAEDVVDDSGMQP